MNSRRLIRGPRGWRTKGNEPATKLTHWRGTGCARAREWPLAELDQVMSGYSAVRRLLSCHEADASANVRMGRLGVKAVEARGVRAA